MWGKHSNKNRTPSPEINMCILKVTHLMSKMTHSLGEKGVSSKLIPEAAPLPEKVLPPSRGDSLLFKAAGYRENGKKIFSARNVLNTPHFSTLSKNNWDVFYHCPQVLLLKCFSKAYHRHVKRPPTN